MATITKSQYVRNVAFTNPLLIPSLLKDPAYDKQITCGILNKLIPYRTSLEIECMGSLSRSMIGFNTPDAWGDIMNKFHLMDYSEDLFTLSPESMNEHRISIKNWTRLPQLYQILFLMKQACQLNPRSGIHIHVDYSSSLRIDIIRKRKLLVEYLRRSLKELEVYDYTGTYNSKRVAMDLPHASTWIRVNSDFGSVEYRIFPCSFEYSIILQWMIHCNNINKRAIQYVNNST